tara:strand:+ start:45 stop:1601 length:1557 start_codon:yes stop_codon:yes gene_type:complete
MADYRELAAALGGGYGQDTGPITPDTRITLKNGKTASAGDLLGLLKGFGQSVGSNLESLGKGGLSTFLGGPVDTANTIRTPYPMEVFGDVNYTPDKQLPGGSRDILGMMPRATAARPETAGMEELGGFMAPATAKVLKPAVTGYARLAGQEISNKLSGQPTRSLLGTITPESKFVYMPTRPRTPPEVGTRYQRTDLGGLLAPQAFDIQKYKNASIGTIPWDNSSRNVRIESVSDEPLINPLITTGGQGHLRDILHQQKKIGGASAKPIVERIANRVDVARKENLDAGGSGIILQTPNTMGAFSENYSVQPTTILLDLFDQRKAAKSKANEINKFVQEDFPAFAGINTPEGRAQLLHVNGGQLRKKFVRSMYTEDNEKYFKFNRQDISNAITDEDLLGVPRGYGLNVVMSHGKKPLILSPSGNPSYSTDFSGEYVGGVGNVPAEVFMRDRYNTIRKEYENAVDKNGKRFNEGQIHDAVISALEKRTGGVFQIIDQKLIDQIKAYEEKIKQRGWRDASRK